jgi:putative spermidine/putrescine transport system permease protein
MTAVNADQASSGQMLSADGRPLKVSLARAMFRNKMRAVALVAPLFLFIFFSFIWPIGEMLFRSIDNPELREGIPDTLALLEVWDREQLPSEEVFATLAREMVEGSEDRSIGKVSARLNREFAGTRSLFNKTIRRVKRMDSGPYKEAFLKIDEDWGDIELWKNIHRMGQPITSAYFAAAVDMRYDGDGNLIDQPEYKQIYQKLFWRTIVMSFMVTVACIALGYPIAYLLATLPMRTSNLLMIMVLLPFWTSLLVRTTSWIVILGKEGVLNETLVWLGILSDDNRLELMFNETGVVIAMTHILLPFMVLPLYSVMKTIPPSYMRAALSLGANPVVAFWKVYVPQTVPGIGAGSILVFIVAIGYYITPALVGGSDGQMISNLIAYHMQKSLNWGLAAALGTILLAGVLLLYWLYNKIVGIDNMKFG